MTAKAVDVNEPDLDPDETVEPEPPMAGAEHESVEEALLAVQGELPKLVRTAYNPHFKSKYVPLEELMETVGPILRRHGLLWVTGVGFTDQETPSLGYRLEHLPTQSSVSGEALLQVAKDNPQAQSAAVTYARRYVLEALLGVTAADDDDGNRATEGVMASKAAARENVLLSPEQVQRMLDGIAASGLDLAEVLQLARIDAVDAVTVGQARAVKGVLDRAEEAKGAPPA